MMAKKLALKVEDWPIDRVLPYAKNARLHSPEQVAAISKSMAEFGFVNPCLVDAEGVLIAGHGRVLAAKSLGMTTVPVIRLGHLTEVQARALRIADNQIALSSSWDLNLLRLEIGDLQLANYDIPLLGFDTTMLDGLMNSNSGEVDPEETPEPPKKPIVRKGDLWVLGRHRLLIGDATKADDVGRLMEGEEKARLMATDPPYGVAYDNSQRPNPGVAKPRVANDELVDGPAMQTFLESMLRAALPHMRDDSAFYFWHPMLTQGTYVDSSSSSSRYLDSSTDYLGKAKFAARSRRLSLEARTLFLWLAERKSTTFLWKKKSRYDLGSCVRLA